MVWASMVSASSAQAAQPRQADPLNARQTRADQRRVRVQVRARAQPSRAMQAQQPAASDRHDAITARTSQQPTPR